METKELPKRYRSWYEFWKELENNGLTNEITVVVNDTNTLGSIDIYKYNVAYIKDKLLSELLDSRGRVQEFTFNDLRMIERMFYEAKRYSPIDDDDLLQKIKSGMDYLYEAGKAV